MVHKRRPITAKGRAGGAALLHPKRLRRRDTPETLGATNPARPTLFQKKGMPDSEDEPEMLQYKVILLGDGATGKTSIAMRFTEDHFAMQYKQTIGLDFFIKRLVLPGDVCLP